MIQHEKGSEEVVREGEKGVSFCGIVIEKIEHGYFIHQRPYTKELLKKHKLEGCNSTKIILDRESDDEDRALEKEQREEWYQNWETTEEFRSKVKESQRIAGEILWLTTRTRPDLCFSIQKMSSLATKNPVKAVQYGVRMLKYLNSTEDFGLKYLTKEETIKKHEDVSEDWPKEVFEEQRAVVCGLTVHLPHKKNKKVKVQWY